MAYPCLKCTHAQTIKKEGNVGIYCTQIRFWVYTDSIVAARKFLSWDSIHISDTSCVEPPGIILERFQLLGVNTCKYKKYFETLYKLQSI